MPSLRLRSNLRRIYRATLILHALLRGVPEAWIFITGLIIALLGRGLQAWASGHLDKVNERRGPDPPVPTSSGPFAHVRNPIAWSSFLSDVGLGILAGAAIPVAVYSAIYWWVAWRRITRYEEPMLRRRCGESYERYIEMTPRLLPRLRRPRGSASGWFSWRRFWDNGELSRLLGGLTLIGVFYLIGLYQREGGTAHPWFWPALGLFATLGVIGLVLQGAEYRPHLVRTRLLRWIRGDRSTGKTAAP
ncbi:MAG: methyltransferase [Planctomycetota bacterium]|nr:methyltransferase [Planctomycetota bacterium]